MIFLTYSDLAPMVILLTLVLSLIIGWNITWENLKGTDSIFAILGFVFGLFMTFMNLVYTSKNLFLLSPVIALSCALYLRYRNEFKVKPSDSLLSISGRNYAILSIIWWFAISAVLLTYYLSEIYTRSPLFFSLISGAVAILGIQIIASYCSSTIKTSIFVIKILLLSIILRYSAYFISPYPVGSDPWAHQEYIKYFLDFGRIAVPPDYLYYYVNYPIAHLYATCTVMLGSISPHDAMFLLGMVLTLSTIVTFLIVKMLTKNVSLALVSMLLLNFTDIHIQWSVQIIAMSFAIALYAFIIFFALKMYLKPERRNRSVFLLLVFLGIIVWTHTISAFITLVSLFALVVGCLLYGVLYDRNIFSIPLQNAQNLIIPLIFLTIIMIYHWMDSSYSFFDTVFGALLNSLSLEAQFLGGTTLSNIHGRWEELLQPIGFCIYVCSGIIGTLYCLSSKEKARKFLPLIVLVLVLFIVRYAFPIFGMRNIIPDRWPAFAFISFVLFVGLGIFCGMSLLKKNAVVICAVIFFFFVGSFFMITDAATNHDSPLYGEEVFINLIWIESEIDLYADINATYDGTIIADEQTSSRPLIEYLKNKKSTSYHILPNGTIDKEPFSRGLVIWRKITLNRPVDVRDDRFVTEVLLGDQFWHYLNSKYNCISNVESARCYLSCN